jgi:hypothetical protein
MAVQFCISRRIPRCYIVSVRSHLLQNSFLPATHYELPLIVTLCLKLSFVWSQLDTYDVSGAKRSPKTSRKKYISHNRQLYNIILLHSINLCHKPSENYHTPVSFWRWNNFNPCEYRVHDGNKKWAQNIGLKTRILHLVLLDQIRIKIDRIYSTHEETWLTPWNRVFLIS